MKKISKFLAVSLALALVLGMTVSAASPSTKNTNIVNKSAAAAAAANNSVSAPAGVEVSIHAATTEQINNVLEEAVNPVTVASIAASYGVTLKDVVFVFDITASSNNTRMSFKVPYVVEGRHYALLHMTSDGKVKEVLPATCSADGWITATFTTYSIYAVVEVDDEVAAQAAAASVSPKTSESLPVVCVVAVVLLAGAFECARRVRFQR